MRQLSSSWTVLHKRLLLPAVALLGLVLGVYAIVTGLATSSVIRFLAVFLLIGPAVFIMWYLRSVVDVVCEEEDCIVVKQGGTTLRIAFAEMLHATELKTYKQGRIVIELLRPVSLGTSIGFIPDADFNRTPAKGGSLVDQLNRKIEAARSADAARPAGDTHHG